MATVPPSHKFFITHSWKDIAFARRLAGDLGTYGLQGFFDDHSISPGENIAARINKGLSECDIYMPILSYAALESPWCEEEITTAIMLSKVQGRQGRPLIIPLLIENCQDKIEEIIPSLLTRLYISFVGRYEEALGDLLEKGFGLSREAIQANGLASVIYASEARPRQSDNVRLAPKQPVKALPVPEQDSASATSVRRSRSQIWLPLLLAEFAWTLAVPVIGTIGGLDWLTNIFVGVGLWIAVVGGTFLWARTALPGREIRILLVGLSCGLFFQYLALWLLVDAMGQLVYQTVTPYLFLDETRSVAIVMTLTAGIFAIFGSGIGATVIAWQLRDAKGYG